MAPHYDRPARWLPGWFFANTRRQQREQWNRENAEKEARKEARVQKRADEIARRWVAEGAVVVVQPSRSYGSSDDRGYVSKRRQQHEWYGEHSELNWRDRETAEMYGMDADTYVSNYLND